MKSLRIRLALLLLTLCTTAALAVNLVRPLQFIKLVTTAGTPVAASASTLYCTSVEIHARKSTATANTGNIKVGFTPEVGTQLRVLAPGDSWTVPIPAGTNLDLSTALYIDSDTNGDGAVISYVP